MQGRRIVAANKHEGEINMKDMAHATAAGQMLTPKQLRAQQKLAKKQEKALAKLEKLRRKTQKKLEKAEHRWQLKAFQQDIKELFRRRKQKKG